MGKGIRIWIAVLAISQGVMASELTQFSRSESELRFNLNCDRYGQYLIQRSSDLTNWSTFHRSSGPSTNRAFNFTGTNYPVASHAFFRAMQTSNLCPAAILATRRVVIGGTNSSGAYVDSYDSSDPLYSTDGRYDPSKRKDQAFVATLSSAAPAIDASMGRIYGHAATAPGGTAIGNIGDGAWLTAIGGVQPGHVWDDFNATIPNVTLPNTNWSTPLVVDGEILVGTGYYKINGDFTSRMTALGNAHVWITGDVRMTAVDEINVSPGRKLKLYIGGQVTISGGARVNSTGEAADCTLYGLTTCTNIQFFGSASATAMLYAPNAHVRLTGTPEIMGSITVEFVELNLGSALHYDEALGR